MSTTPRTLSSAARNERIKLTATLLNTVASGFIVVGGVTPIAAIAFGVPAGPTREVVIGIVIAVGFVGFGIALHSVARKILESLE
jgi:hypothetical protein